MKNNTDFDDSQEIEEITSGETEEEISEETEEETSEESEEETSEELVEETSSYIDDEETHSEVLTHETILQSVDYDIIDYTSYFENLQTIGIVIICLLIGYIMSFSFLKGFKK